jgi:hypothetical protein
LGLHLTLRQGESVAVGSVCVQFVELSQSGRRGGTARIVVKVTAPSAAKIRRPDRHGDCCDYHATGGLDLRCRDEVAGEER